MPTLEMKRTARLSGDGRSRYVLTREWGDGPRVTWMMLNPSKADAETDDPTVIRTIGFSKAWGFGSLAVVNLFPLRATDPKVILPRIGRTSPESNLDIGWNRTAVIEEARGRVVVAAWGARVGSLYYAKELASRAQEVATAMICLGLTADGNPKHPLYVAGATAPVIFPTGEPWARTPLDGGRQ